MASRATNRARRKKWRARAKRNNINYLLGYFETKEEAEEVERRFREQWPPVHGTSGKHWERRTDGTRILI